MTRVVRADVTTVLGTYTVAATERGVCYLSLDPARTERELAAWVERHEAGATVEEDRDALADVARQIVEWSEGKRTVFDVSLDLRGTAFQLSCWEELLRIPAGETRTYGELAERIGRAGSARAVGAANGANPVPVLVPCHRIVAQGGLGGFGGGLERKRQMLELEGALLPFGG
ncbi:MAG: methylated-DNA--[protein]-cysteine S-methyltransferase [bacterium]|nr:methylated-DNA--[protein]-cysteine S-methyltransferase [bacterium]